MYAHVLMILAITIATISSTPFAATFEENFDGGALNSNLQSFANTGYTFSVGNGEGYVSAHPMAGGGGSGFSTKFTVNGLFTADLDVTNGLTPGTGSTLYFQAIGPEWSATEFFHINSAIRATIAGGGAFTTPTTPRPANSTPAIRFRIQNSDTGFVVVSFDAGSGFSQLGSLGNIGGGPVSFRAGLTQEAPTGAFQEGWFDNLRITADEFQGLVPIPEPAIWMTMLAGIGLLGFARMFHAPVVVRARSSLFSSGDRLRA